MSLLDLSARQFALVSNAISIGATVCFYFVLRHVSRAHRARQVLLALLFLLALTAPFLIPEELRKVSRFMVALFSLMLAFKMWDLHVSDSRREMPDPRQFFAFLANLLLIVWRKRSAERQPTPGRNLVNLLLTILHFLGSYAALVLINRLDWMGTPFLIVHTFVALSLMWMVVSAFSLMVAVTRLCGAYSLTANDSPYQARTPAEFWRRYNRIVGQFLHENVFKFANGRRHPVRATMLAFFISGLFHEYLFWIAIGRSPGLQMTFFLLQGAAVAATLRVRPKGAKAIWWWLLTWSFMVISSVPFFASFEHMVPVYPLALPAWLAAW